MTLVSGEEHDPPQGLVLGSLGHNDTGHPRQVDDALVGRIRRRAQLDYRVEGAVLTRVAAPTEPKWS